MKLYAIIGARLGYDHIDEEIYYNVIEPIVRCSHEQAKVAMRGMCEEEVKKYLSRSKNSDMNIEKYFTISENEATVKYSDEEAHLRIVELDTDETEKIVTHDVTVRREGKVTVAVPANATGAEILEAAGRAAIDNMVWTENCEFSLKD